MRSILGQLARPLPSLSLGAPARSVAVLRDLHAADRTLGMRAPAAPNRFPMRDLMAARRAMFHTADLYADVAAEIEAALAELAALAPLTAKAVAL